MNKALGVLRSFSYQLPDGSSIQIGVDLKQFGHKKRVETERLAALLKGRAEAGAAINPTRVEFVGRIEAS